MLIIKENDNTYNIPTSWDDVTTERYYKLLKVISIFQDEDGNVTANEDVVFNKVIEILCDIKKGDLNKLSIENYTLIRGMTTFLSEFITLKEVTHVKPIIFKNLVIKPKQYDKMTFGEFADAQHLRELGADKVVDSIALTVDIFERRNIKKFKFKDRKLDLTIEERVKILNEIPCTKINELMSFFLPGLTKYQRHIAQYLNRMALHQHWSNNSQIIGVIISSLWTYVLKTPQRWRMRFQ